MLNRGLIFEFMLLSVTASAVASCSSSSTSEESREIEATQQQAADEASPVAPSSRESANDQTTPPSRSSAPQLGLEEAQREEEEREEEDNEAPEASVAPPPTVSGPKPNADLTLPLACFGEGVLHASCDYFPAISRDGRHILAIDGEGHAADSDLYLRILNVSTQKVKSHFLVFGYDGHSQTEVSPKASIVTLHKRLPKVNRIIKRMQPEPMTDLLASQGDIKAVIEEMNHRTKTLRVINGDKTLLEEQYEIEGELRVHYSPMHQVLYTSWGEEKGDGHFSIWGIARKAIRLGTGP